MPKLRPSAGPIGLALTAYETWRRLSPRQRRIIVSQAKRYAPLIAAQAVRSARTAKTSLRAR